MSEQPVINTRCDLDTAIDYIYRLEAEIDRLKTERRWIPVSERLPEFFQQVIVCCKDGYETSTIRLAFGLETTGFPFADVTHWMTLPPPPEDEL